MEWELRFPVRRIIRGPGALSHRSPEMEHKEQDRV